MVNKMVQFHEKTLRGKGKQSKPYKSIKYPIQGIQKNAISNCFDKNSTA